MKRAGKAIVISLNLKEIYDKKENKIVWDKLYEQIFKQISENFFREYFGEKKPT